IELVRDDLAPGRVVLVEPESRIERSRVQIGGLEQVRRNNIPARERNLVVWERRLDPIRVRSKWIVKRDTHFRSKPGKVPVSIFRWNHRIGAKCRGRSLAKTLVVAEEEEFVVLNGAAQSAAEFVPANRRPHISVVIPGPVVRVQLIVAEELERGAMQLVGSGLQCDVDDPTLEVPELRGSVVRDHLDFLDRIRAWYIRRPVVGGFVIIYSVQEEIVGFRPVSVDI